MSYQPVQWTDGEAADDVKLNQMAANDDYLYQNIIDGKYDAHGVVKDSGLKIWSRVISIPPNHKHVVSADVYFGTYFSAGCRPVIASTLATADRVRSTVSIRALDGTRIPDNQGFRVVLYYINAEGQYLTFDYPQHIHIIAIGY